MVVSIVNSLVAYKHACPGCGAKHSDGYNAQGTAWETRCVRCKMLYKYGEFGRDVEVVYDFRCPHCHRRRHLGVAAPGSWWETKCFRCRQYYHHGIFGRGPVAEIETLGIQHLSGAMSHVRAEKILGAKLDLLRDTLVIAPESGSSLLSGA